MSRVSCRSSSSSAPFAALVAVLLLSYSTADATLDVKLGAVVRVGANAGAVLTVGALLFAAFLVAPQKSGTLAAGGYAALRAAAWSALLWFVVLARVRAVPGRRRGRQAGVVDDRATRR